MRFVRWITLVLISGQLVRCNKPVLDLSNNMRLVLIPADTKLGTPFYKLRASDADDDYPLEFRAFGADSEMIRIENVDCSRSICEADVVLVKTLSKAKGVYRLNLEVKDTRGEKTVVETEIKATNEMGPFMGAPRMLRLSEKTLPDTLVESFHVRENPKLFRGISCKLLPTSANQYFQLSPGLPTALDGVSRCDLRLKTRLDYETRSSFVLQLIAENAWTDAEVDTRNVLVHEFIVEVRDVQDTSPYFLTAPPVTTLPETAKEGDSVLQVSAFDGDYAHPRRIRYGLDPSGLPFSSYFAIHPDTGIVTVRKSLMDIKTRLNSPVILRIFAEELEDDGSASDQRSDVLVAVIIDDVINRKPKFLQDTYIISLEENAVEGTQLVFDGDLNVVQDLDKGENGMVELLLDGYEDTFEVSPSVVEGSGQFSIGVKNNKRLDYEKIQTLEFRIVAREIGVSKLESSAQVVVHLIDENDNTPEFLKEEYVVNEFENAQPGTVIAQVSARDGDSKVLGHVRYNRLIGEENLINGLRLDPKSGEISIATKGVLDRERAEKHLITVEAVDNDGQEGFNVAEVNVVINVLDVNDEAPKFLRKKYQGFMSKDLTRLRNHLQVEAKDEDSPDSRNSHIRYEIIQGNYENKFEIDKFTGEITVALPLTTNNIARISRRDSRQARKNELASFDEDNFVSPVISLVVRAYDLGIPSLADHVPVHIFTEEVSSRTMRFIVDQPPEVVERKEEEISDLISTLTGGDTEIQDIKPYFGVGDGDGDVTQIDYERNAKTVTSQPRKSLVDVFIRYPANSMVDLNAVASKLASNRSGSVTNVLREKDSRSVTQMHELELRNAALFWGLVALCLLIAAIVLTVLCCCCCPGCPCYKDSHDKTPVRRLSTPGEEEIRVLTVKDSRGRELRDAKFVEILKSARNRLRSAASLSRVRWRGVGTSENDSLEDHRANERDRRNYRAGAEFANRAFEHHPESIVYVGEAQPGGVARAFEELDPGALGEPNPGPPGGIHFDRAARDRGLPAERFYRARAPLDRKRVFKFVDPDQRVPSRQGGEDVQILRLDEETRREETYKKSGNSEVLNLEEQSEVGEARGGEVQEPGGGERPETPRGPVLRRTRSELDLTRAGILEEDGQDEFYTAVGPDGKEIILRRYLNDQTPELDPLADRGFLNMAMVHLQQQHQGRRNNSRANGFDTGESDLDEDDASDFSARHNQRRWRSKKKSFKSSGTDPIHPEIHASNHQIRTPILEETESNLDAEELLKSRQSRRDMYKISYDNSDASVLRCKINDGRDSPEPAYAETKASILRRRNTMAKLLSEEDRAYHQSLREKYHNMKNRHWSLQDLNRRAKNSLLRRDANIRKWNSLANDELMNREDAKYSLRNTIISQEDLKASQGGRINLTPLPKTLTHVEKKPRKFSKSNSSSATPQPPTDLRPARREPMWSRLAKSLKRVYDHQDAEDEHQNTSRVRPQRQRFQEVSSEDSLSEGEETLSMPSRSSSTISLSRREEIESMMEERHSNRKGVDDNVRKNMGFTTDNSRGRNAKVTLRPPDPQAQSSRSPSLEFTYDQDGEIVGNGGNRRQPAKVAPRYMEWYNPHKMSTASRSGTIFVDQDQEANDNSNSGAATLEEDDESGISSLTTRKSRRGAHAKTRSGILEKKSVFTIAYEDVAKKMRPSSAEVLMD